MGSKRTINTIGVLFGIAIIIIGIFVMQISVEKDGQSVGSYMTFGGDFFTEIYDVTRDVGGAVNNAQNNICSAIQSVCVAIGWLIVAIGIFDICYFLSKLAAVDEKNHEQIIAQSVIRDEKRTAKKEAQRLERAKANMMSSKIADYEFIDITCPNCKADLSYTKAHLQTGDVNCPLCDTPISL